jgi:hypothetical protein
MKGKNWRNERKKRNIYIKIMYREAKVLPNTLGGTIAFSMFREVAACDFL